MGTHPLCGLLDCVSSLGLICVDISTDGIAAELQLYAGHLLPEAHGPSLPAAAPRGLPSQGVQPLLLTTNSLTRCQSTLAPLCSRFPSETRRRPTNMSKKGAKSQETDQSYEVRDIVLAKVRGFPPWPGMVSIFRIVHRVPASRMRITSSLA